jgi:hypothetical protein
MSWIYTISSDDTKGDDTMKRVRHLAYTPQRGGQIREDEQQAVPIYDAIAQAVHKWNILGLTKFDDLAYETDILWLLQHLPATSHRNDVEELLKERFAGRQGSHQCDPEDVLRMKALAEDIWHTWSQYLQRHEPSTFSQAHSRARGLMGRHYPPRTNSH